MSDFALSATGLPPTLALNSGGLRSNDAKRAAEEFESVFIHQLLESMFSGLETDGPFGGGPSEGIYRSLMNDAVAKQIAKSGGLGIGDAVMREILKAQEAHGHDQDQGEP